MKTCTLAELSEAVGAVLHGDPLCEVNAIAPLGSAGPGALSFLSNKRYLKFLKSTGATAVILTPEYLSDCPCHAMVVEDPYLGYAKAARFMYSETPYSPGIHPAAIVHPSATISASATVAAHAVVSRNAIIGPGTYIGPGTVIGDDVVIGADTRLLAAVTLYQGVIVGDHVIIHAGVVIGADGFGIAEQPDRSWLKIPQLGTVIIKDDVEIGANTTIDRGSLGDTLIEEGVKIDNQVQIGHNVTIGAHTAIAGCVGIAGSVRIGRNCRIGGGCGISGHLELADGVVLTAMSGVSNSIRHPGVYSSPLSITDNHTWRKNVARFHRLDQTLRNIMDELKSLRGKIN